jgi:ribonuclease R
MPAGEEAPEPAAMEESKPKPAPRGGPENNPRNRLQELCAKRKAPLPTFTVEERGSPNNRTFEAVVTVMIDGTKRSSRPARDRTRKGAEKAAAAEMLATLATNRFRG